MSKVVAVTPFPRRENPRIITIGPPEATALLEANTINRPIDQRHVDRIARSILAGKWKFNGDTIKISSKRTVLDGQHRLWAVIESQCKIETVIVEGIDEDAFSTIDTLRKPRSGADVLSLLGVQQRRGQVATTLAWLIRFQRKCLETFREPKNRIENSDVEQAFKENPTIMRAVERCAPLHGIGNQAVFAFLYYIVSNRDPELAERMVNTLAEPAGVPISDPFFRLRVFITGHRQHRRRNDALYVIAAAIKALNAAARGDKVGNLTWRSQGKTPEPFPVLKI